MIFTSYSPSIPLRRQSILSSCPMLASSSHGGKRLFDASGRPRYRHQIRLPGTADYFLNGMARHLWRPKFLGIVVVYMMAAISATCCGGHIFGSRRSSMFAGEKVIEPFLWFARYFQEAALCFFKWASTNIFAISDDVSRAASQSCRCAALRRRPFCSRNMRADASAISHRQYSESRRLISAES